MPIYCEIKIEGHLDPGWSKWFGDLRVSHIEGDGTLLSGMLADQSALHGLFERIRDLNLNLISVNCGGQPSEFLGSRKQRLMDLVEQSGQGKGKEDEMAVLGKWLRVRVTDMKTGKNKANVRVPASLASFGMKMAAKYAPDSMEGLDLDEIMIAVQNGSEGKLVEVEDEEKGEQIEIYVE